MVNREYHRPEFWRNFQRVPSCFLAFSSFQFFRGRSFVKDRSDRPENESKGSETQDSTTSFFRQGDYCLHRQEENAAHFSAACFVGHPLRMEVAKWIWLGSWRMQHANVFSCVKNRAKTYGRSQLPGPMSPRVGDRLYRAFHLPRLWPITFVVLRWRHAIASCMDICVGKWKLILVGRDRLYRVFLSCAIVCVEFFAAVQVGGSVDVIR